MKSSESIKNLATALCRAQTKISNLYPSSKGYGYDYVPLEKIIDMLKATLPEFGLSYIQLPVGGNNGVTVGLTTRIMHESGEWLEETAEFPITDMKGVNKTQAGGAAITYFRRYALISAFGVTGDKDVDASDKALTPKESNNKELSDDSELINQTIKLESYINDGLLQGSYLTKAKLYITNKNLEGIKNTISWIESQKTA